MDEPANEENPELDYNAELIKWDAEMKKKYKFHSPRPNRNEGCPQCGHTVTINGKCQNCGTPRY